MPRTSRGDDASHGDVLLNADHRRRRRGIGPERCTTRAWRSRVPSTLPIPGLYRPAVTRDSRLRRRAAARAGRARADGHCAAVARVPPLRTRTGRRARRPTAAGQPASEDPQGGGRGRGGAIRPRSALPAGRPPSFAHRRRRRRPCQRGHTVTGTSVRSTRQRAAISTLLETLDEFRSAQELHDELRRRGENIGLTTVYRTLQSMAAAGMVDTLRTDTGESVY